MGQNIENRKRGQQSSSGHPSSRRHCIPTPLALWVGRTVGGRWGWAFLCARGGHTSLPEGTPETHNRPQTPTVYHHYTHTAIWSTDNCRGRHNGRGQKTRQHSRNVGRSIRQSVLESLTDFPMIRPIACTQEVQHNLGYL